MLQRKIKILKIIVSALDQTLCPTNNLQEYREQKNILSYAKKIQ